MSTTKLINNILVFKNCCGCGCCEKVCPKNAIVMIKDQRGFFRPHVDETKCINCGICKKQCEFNILNGGDNRSLHYYAFKANDATRECSQSGGAFFELAKSFLLEYPNNSTVYGAILSNCRQVKHIRVIDLDELYLLQKSKYAKSDLGSSFDEIYKDLIKGRYVLFSGTPCQVAAIKSYLSFKKTNLEKLLLVDIVCHGTPSSQFWSEYIDYVEKKNHSKVVEANFRDKSFGWSSHYETFLLENGKKIKAIKYRDLFYSYHSLDEACFVCKYASYNRYSDITLADMWGNQSNLNDFKDKKGVSLVITNNDKGQKYLNRILSTNEYREVKKEETKQPNLLHPSLKPKDYDKFWKYYQKKGFEKTIKKYVDHNYKKKISDFNKRVKNKLKRMFG